MTSIYIKSTDFTLAKQIKASLEDRIINSSLVPEIEPNKVESVTSNYNTYVCSSAWENKLGGQPALLDAARKLRAKNIIVVHEESDSYQIEKHLGGNLIRFHIGKNDASTNLNQSFSVQLLLSLIQPKDSMTAGDINSHQLLKLSKKVSEADVTVFINGPTGTGKEVLSKFIHKHSNRKDKAFVGINCAAIPENMLEAILFGHEKGAFTGASTSNKGIFRAADGGTLLLDEISEMPLSLQAKLLRVLQEKIVTPLGSQQEVPVDVRVVATTNRCMAQEIKTNRFREDLFYRLNVFPLLTKPLADRQDDIIPIVTNLLIRHVPDITKIPYVNPDAINALLNYNWPGNVRELENVVQRALVLCSEGTISELDIIVDSTAGDNSVQENLRDQILSKATQIEEVGNV
ncbi:MAG: AAA family ATPase [Rhodobacteraceae bacterium]|nr:MAG: AAA family ATPase [Paracoccaceae bacterium]|tara:strand:- start:1288 stop:2496 length:1209 start_codon:yes stop_codon:yes gene_type:complete